MAHRGRHLAPRTKARKMRLFGRAVPLALALVLMMTAVAWASHSTSISFDPGSTVSEGTIVTVAANSDPADSAPKLELHVCQTAAEGVPIVPTAYSPWQTCEVGDGSAVWFKLAEQGPASAGEVAQITYPFHTTGLGGVTVGFKSHRNPGSHPDATDFGNLVINPLPTSNGDHPGCKGIANALSKVSTNNGSAKGKGGEALEQVADKLGCELSG